jgi:hypothetical protein
MKLNILILVLIATCPMISPVLAQDSLPSIEQSELNRRERDTQSLDAQAQYNLTFHGMWKRKSGSRWTVANHLLFFIIFGSFFD